MKTIYPKNVEIVKYLAILPTYGRVTKFGKHRLKKKRRNMTFRLLFGISNRSRYMYYMLKSVRSVKLEIPVMQ